LHTLRELREAVAHRLDACRNDREYTVLVTQLRLIMAEIDELAELRGERLAGAADMIVVRRAQRRQRGEPVAVEHSAGGRRRARG